VRLTQVKNDTHNPLAQRYAAILNTAHFVAEVLREWSELVVSLGQTLTQKLYFFTVLRAHQYNYNKLIKQFQFLYNSNMAFLN